MTDSVNPNASSNISSTFLPRVYRSDANTKFLHATIEQLTQRGSVSKLNGYIGRQNAKAASGDDVFIKAVDSNRQNYQLEPSLIIDDQLGNTTFFKDYQDYINRINLLGGITTNHARLNQQEFYSWNPNINWDKFVNFQNYYWMPEGPEVITINGQQQGVISSISVKTTTYGNTTQYLFSPDGITVNPGITLYRGQTYNFIIDALGNPFSIKTLRSLGTANRYTNGVSANGIETGVITFTVPMDAPDQLFYQSENNFDAGGGFVINDIDQNTLLNVELDVIGKQHYTLSNGISLSNGMLVEFAGNVIPSTYASGTYYIEGVGENIQLIDSSIFFTSSTTKEYITIGKTSKNGNPWSRNNRWVHADVIKTSSEYNNNIPTLDQTARASRPIIEFSPNLKLFNYGKVRIADVDLLDDVTIDVFSEIEGKIGYSIDQIDLAEGQYVMFTADNDVLVKNNIYQVQFVEHSNGDVLLHLELMITPEIDDIVLISSGAKAGNYYWFNGTDWIYAQQKTLTNQAPLFDVYDENGVSLSDNSSYLGSSFTGTKLFTYKVGTGKNDSELGFPLSYKNVSNIGDIVFNFDYDTDTFDFQQGNDIVTEYVKIGYLLNFDSIGNSFYDNGWVTNSLKNTQAAIRIYKNSGLTNNFNIDIFDDIDNLDDLDVKVYVNGKRLYTGWNVIDTPVYKQVVLDTAISLTDILTIRAFTVQPVNNNGFYEIPINLQNNPNNGSISSFTLGEVSDHVNSIVDNNSDFVGAFPGVSNLRDLGKVSQYGTKFVKHSGPFSLAMYHFTDDTIDIVKAIEKSRDDYNKFKRNFITVAETMGVDTDVKTHVDLILKEMVKDIPSTDPYYFSDMVPFGAYSSSTYQVIDVSFTKYPLMTPFNLNDFSNRAVGVYLNGVQLIAFHEYIFNEYGFVEIITPLKKDDEITIYEYENTDGCFVPETPSKLGIWPTYDPKMYLDTTLITPVNVIQGHDGSLILSYGDYRDDLILELEKRIYNNIKSRYNEDVFDIHDVLPFYYKENEYPIDEFNSILAASFYKWASFVNIDFTTPVRFDPDNPFTYNYTGMYTPDGQPLPGYWRGIYSWVYQTDRPNLCPWEMLGINDEPEWWSSVYGAAPYTSDNLIMWDDISKGILREPNQQPIILTKFQKPYLMNHIPVDEYGNLIDPLACGIATGIISQSISNNFNFGDVGPVENAWRRSSYFPYSVILTALLMRPTKIIGTLLDTSRIARNKTNQIVYSESKSHISSDVIKLPSVYTSTGRVQTSGLINFVVNYIVSNNLISYEEYFYNITNINFKLSYRVGGFTNKNQFQLLLDSKSPLTTGSVFVPYDDYYLLLNDSSVTKKISYSGVIITKLSNGYSVKGYSKSKPYFTYYQWNSSGSTINIGGISESFVDWTVGNTYSQGQIVKYNNKFYRAVALVSNVIEFDYDKFQALSSLPIIGGVTATFRNGWDKTTPISIPYNSKFDKIQDVVDFLLGYGEWLQDQGFVFDDYNQSVSQVCNWETSAKEFMFWTTQNWSAGQDKWAEWLPNTAYQYNTIVRYNGEYYIALRNIEASSTFDYDYFEKLDGLNMIGSAVISLSPAAYKITFKTSNNVVDNIANPFNDYEIFKVDGNTISPSFLKSSREDNLVSYSPTNDDGIYAASFYLIQKEHVVILNNTTVFNDLIYDKVTGYKQDRIKISAYVSSDWYGGFEIPGFIYDDASVSNWESWKNYIAGDLVQYQSFYYTAKSYIPGSAEFNSNEWVLLNKKPVSQILPNWTNIATQFKDFYTLEVENFNDSQQLMAQHLIGYQKRQYLDNIIKDNVSEFKFYQGMITDKGTQNVFNKLFGVLNSDQSLAFYEEWALRVGQYGANAAFEEIEFILDEQKVSFNPQGFELVNETYESNSNYIIQQLPSDLYVKPYSYNSNPWKSLVTNRPYLRSAGYVREIDIIYSMKSLDNLTDKDSSGNFLYPINTFTVGSYIWCTFEDSSWNVYRYSYTDSSVVSLTYSNDTITLIVTKELGLIPGQYLGIANVSFEGFYKIKTVLGGNVTLTAPGLAISMPFTETASIVLYKFTPQRIDTIDNANSLLPYGINTNEKLWVDNNGSNKWTIYQFNPVYNGKLINNPYPQLGMNYGRSVAIDDTSKNLIIATTIGQVYIYRKLGNVRKQLQTLAKPFISNNYQIPESAFGEVVDISFDGEWIAVSTPTASHASTTVFDNLTYDSTINNVDNTIITVDNTSGSLNVITSEEYDVIYTVQSDINTPAADSSLLNQGVVSLYKRGTNNTYYLYGTVVSPNIQENEYFGNSLSFTIDENQQPILYVGANGSNNGLGCVYKLKYKATVKATPTYNPIGSSGKILKLTGKNGKPGSTGITFGMYVRGTGFASDQRVVSVNGDFVELTAAPDTQPSGILQFVTYEWKYDLSTNYVGTISNELFGLNVKTSKDNTTMVVSSDKCVRIYKNNTLIQTLTGTIVAFSASSCSISGDIVITINAQPGTILLVESAVTGTIQVGQSITGPGVLPGTYIVDGSDNIWYLNQPQLVTHQPMTGSSQTTKFGQSIAVSDYADYIAISEPEYNSTFQKQGRVKIYKFNSVTNQYDDYQEILNTSPDTNEYFGTHISFMNDYKTLVVHSQYKNTASGNVDIYDRYLNNWIFSERLSLLSFTADSLIIGNSYTIQSLGTTDFTAVGASSNAVGVTFIATGTTSGTGTAYLNFENDQYSLGFAVGDNSIIIGTPTGDDQYVDSGLVFEYWKNNNAYSWTSILEEINKPDVSKIKKAFLYNKSTNKFITYLDVIDAFQGKIAGPAQEEISYNTFYDPAIYSIGTSDVNVDAGLAWTTNQVGKIWWDLRTTKFVETYVNDVVYRTSVWNVLAPGASVDIYEWVESSYKPADWDSLADTEAGLAMNISGQSLYGDTVYSVKTIFDNVSKTKKYTYYFWVKNKVTVPNMVGRKISANAISNLIGNPVGTGYQYIALTGTNSFELVNVQSLLANDDVVLSLQYWTIDKTDQNVHAEWKLISNDPSTVLPTFIEEKWFDSLCGSNSKGNLVPDPSLSPKLKYGIENRPLQSMFVNRFEALKQYIEQVNLVLIKNDVVNTKNVSVLNVYDEAPPVASRKYDISVDTKPELAAVNISSYRKASISPIIVDGKIVSIKIDNAGLGYIVPPLVEVNGSGVNAVIKLAINTRGQVVVNSISDTIINTGEGYDYNTTLEVRDFSVLVQSDVDSNGVWAIYSYANGEWNKTNTQSYDVRKYWSYTDWYKDGFNQFTAANYEVAYYDQLNVVSQKIGDIVKVRYNSTGNWVLVKRKNTLSTLDWTENFDIIGIQHGTIQLSSMLYGSGSYDSTLYDSTGYDYNPTIELRIILNAIKNYILVDELKQSYLDIFFNNVRYAFTEQNYIDWIFKTSFVKAKNNAGKLHQSVVYRNDNLADYEAYIAEVKPYRTKIRQYISSYRNIDTGEILMTDFDLPPIYNEGGTTVIEATVVDNEIQSYNTEINQAPWKNWLDNVGFSVTEIRVISGGYGYTSVPTVSIISDSGSGATAVAVVEGTIVTRIDITNPGSGYLSAPTIVISESEGAYTARAVAIIGNSKVRTMSVGIKFDRIMSTYCFNTLQHTESSYSYLTAGQSSFDLTWAPDIKLGNSTVYIDGVLVPSSSYTLSVVKDPASLSTNKLYTTISGKITFNSPVKYGSLVQVTYYKDISILQATDRIQYFYNPDSTDIGKDLSQLLLGVDYGGVNVNGLNFLYSQGWDSSPFMFDRWDAYDPTYTDYTYIVPSSGSGIAIELPYTPVIGSKITVYNNGNRIDDEYFGVQPNPSLSNNYQTNSQAVMVTPLYTGVTNSEVIVNNGVVSIKLPNTYNVNTGDVIVLRDITSDGSIKPDVDDYDATYDGGNLAYTTATGYRPSDLIVDGDKEFVTPLTSHAPEEVVPGQVVDAMSIRVYNPLPDISGNIKVQKHFADGQQSTFAIGQPLNSEQALIVINESVSNVNGTIQTDTVYQVNSEDYTVNFDDNTVTFITPPVANTVIGIYSIGVNVSDVIDIGFFVGNGFASIFPTRSMWKDNISGVVYINGEVVPSVLENIGGIAQFVLTGVIPENVIANYILVDNTVRTFTITSIQEIPTDGRTGPYQLTNIVGDALNTEDTMIVRVGDTILPSAEYSYILPINGGPAIQFNQQFDGVMVEIFSSYNNINLGIQREEIDATPAIIPTIDTAEYYYNLQIQGGIVDISMTVVNENYLWVIKNGILLIPSVDYVLNDDRSSITLLLEGLPTDVFDIITFASNKNERTGYMLFKDMLNRFHYKNLTSKKQTVLAAELLDTDEYIVLESANGFDAPNPAKNRPGVVMIGAERIEYFKIDGNKLTQLRRATLGTGSKSKYNVGTIVEDIGPSLTIVYNDVTETEVVEITADVVNSGYLIPTTFDLVKSTTTWSYMDGYTSIIPVNYGQCDNVEVFVNNYNIVEWSADTNYIIGDIVQVANYTYRCIMNHTSAVFNNESSKWVFVVANVRLKKEPYVASNVNISMYSPAADIQFDADYSVDGSTNNIRLTYPLPIGTTLTIVKKIGTDWGL